MEFLVVVIGGECADPAVLCRAVELSDKLFYTGVVASSSAMLSVALRSEGSRVVDIPAVDRRSLQGVVAALDGAERLLGLFFDGVVVVWEHPELLSEANLSALRDCFDEADTQVAGLYGAMGSEEVAPCGIFAFKAGTLRRLAALCRKDVVWCPESWTAHGFVVKKAMAEML